MDIVAVLVGIAFGVLLTLSVVGGIYIREIRKLKARHAKDLKNLITELTSAVDRIAVENAVPPITTEEDLKQYIDIEEVKNGIAT